MTTTSSSRLFSTSRDMMALIATAGHVDHGKSSLVNALTGVDPDRLEEEKRRGLTIDLGFAHVATSRGTVLSFIDVPGHSDFIRTMISGVSGVSIALLVVDAAEGWKPQTEEHFGILHVLGVRHGVIALTKCDKVDNNTLHERELQISQRIATSSISWSPTIRTSAKSREGLDELIQQLEHSVEKTSLHVDETRSRLFIDRVFTIKGSGTVVTGTVEGNGLHIGSDVTVVRTGEVARIRNIHIHGAEQQHTHSGQRCALNLSGIEVHQLRRGDALVVNGQWHTTTVFDGQLDTLATLDKPVNHRGSFMVHIGTNAQSASMRLIGATSIAAGESQAVRIRFAEPLALTPKDRFLLRETGSNITIGGGVILDVDPKQRLGKSQPTGTIESQLEQRGFVTVEEAQRLTGVLLTPRFGRWVCTENEFQRAINALTSQISVNGSLDISVLSESERELVHNNKQFVVADGLVRHNNTADPLLQHPYVEMFHQNGIRTPDTKTLDRNIIRLLVNKGIVFEHDFIAFHVDVLHALRPQLEKLWTTSPGGFTMSQLRDALDITRKHALPLAMCLDKIGFTKRQGDVRVPGSRW